MNRPARTAGGGNEKGIEVIEMNTLTVVPEWLVFAVFGGMGAAGLLALWRLAQPSSTSR